MKTVLFGRGFLETNLRFFGSKSYTNLSLIFASPYLRLLLSVFWRPVLIGRPLLDIEDGLADCLEVLGEEEVWGIFPEKDC